METPEWNKKCSDHLADATNHLFGLDETSTLAELFRACISDVIIFRSDTRNSFYHPDLPGVIFINIAQQETRDHLVEELVHQSGHAAIDHISSDCSKFVNSNMLASYDAEHSHVDLEHDSLTVRFHSLVTLTLICEIFHHSLSSAQGQQKELLTVRLYFAFQKLSYDIQNFIREMPILKTDGLIFLKSSIELYQCILSLRRSSFEKCNLLGQPYYFDEDIFLSHN